jgi:hypothetical protein
MKRKSIFLTIVAALFANVAWGQVISWPTGWGADVKGSDTIYLCSHPDSLYPLELGYDVSGRNLHPTYGDWSLISKTSNDVTVDDYEMTSTKNGGAGNAYRTVGSGIGGLLFQYKAKSEDGLCGLAKNQKYWVYVFILPDAHDPISPIDTFICYKTPRELVPINFGTVSKFADRLNLYQKAGFNYKWKKSNGSAAYSVNIKSDSVATYSLVDTLILTAKHGYTCGDTVEFRYGVTVDSIVTDTLGAGFGICVKDTTLYKEELLVDIFKRTVPPINLRYFIGSGTTPVIKVGGNWGSTFPTSRIYRLEFNDCQGNPHKVYDTLYIRPVLTGAGSSNLGIDTVVDCRKPGKQDILDVFYKETSYPGGKPILTQNEAHWKDLGIDTTGNYVNYLPGTTTGTTSLIASSLYEDIMVTSTAYHYRWTYEPTGNKGDCFTGPDGVPANGIMVVILQDPVAAQDYTAQLCSDSYPAANPTFDLNLYTGLNVAQWKQQGVATPIGHTINVPALAANISSYTYKFYYDVESGCVAAGSGKSGVFYIKITSKVKAPALKEVKYCISKLPTSINLNDVLGVAVNGLSWTASGTVEGFNGTTGILDILEYRSAHPGFGATTLTFTASASAGCGVGGNVVKISFVNNL